MKLFTLFLFLSLQQVLPAQSFEFYSHVNADCCDGKDKYLHKWMEVFFFAEADSTVDTCIFTNCSITGNEHYSGKMKPVAAGIAGITATAYFKNGQKQVYTDVYEVIEEPEIYFEINYDSLAANGKISFRLRDGITGMNYYLMNAGSFQNNIICL